MKIPKTAQLGKQAKSYNRKAFRKKIISYIKELNKCIRDRAKTGSTKYIKTFMGTQDQSWETFILFRWYRRYSGLNVMIIERIIEIGGKRYIKEMEVSIRW